MTIGNPETRIGVERAENRVVHCGKFLWNVNSCCVSSPALQSNRLACSTLSFAGKGVCLETAQ